MNGAANRKVLASAIAMLAWGVQPGDVRTVAQPAAVPAGQRPQSRPPLRHRFVFEARVTVGKPAVVGPSSLGLRRVVPITGGRVQGPRLQAQVVPGGADFQFVRADGVLSIDAKYTLQTDDGASILVTNRGLRRGPPEVIDRLTRGEPVDPSEYYFRTVAEFEAPSGTPHEWLNRSLFIGVGERQASGVVIRFYEIE